MKRILFLSPLLLICAFVLFSCALDKKSRFTNNGAIVKIEPSVVPNLPIGSSITLTAIVRNAKNEELDFPVSWSVSSRDSALGEFSSTSGKTVTFTARGNGVSIISAISNGITGRMNAGCGDARAPDTIVISSAPAGLTNGSSALLTATLYSGGIGGTPVIMDHEEEILWEVSGPGTISAASGNSVTFTANAAPAFGQASVKVSVGNVSAVVNIFVADAAMPSKDARMILTDAGLDSAVNDQFPIWGDWHQYPSGEDSSRQPQPPVTSNLVLSDALGQGITIDPEKALQLDFTQPTGTGNYWAGFTLQFATPVSGFSYLNFYAKGNTGNIIAEVVDSSNGKTAIPFPIGSNWKFCYIPVTGKNIKEINFMFRKDDNSQTGTAYLDFIYFDNEIPGSL